MNGENSVETAPLGTITNPASLGLPPFAAYYTLRREKDGRLFAVAEVEGSTVFVQSSKMKEMTVQVKSGDAAQNYGVNLPQLHQQMSGTLQTNDPGFGPRALGSATTTTPLAKVDPIGTGSTIDPSPYLVPGAIVAAALIVGFLGRFARRK